MTADRALTPEVIVLVNYERRFYVTPKTAAEAILDQFWAASGRENLREETRVVRYTNDSADGGEITDAARAAVVELPPRPVYPITMTDLFAKLTPEEERLAKEYGKADRAWRKASVEAIAAKLGLR